MIKLRFNDIINLFKNNRKLEKGSNWLKTRLFTHTKNICEPLFTENQIYPKQYMIYLHNFLADSEVGFIMEHISQEAADELMKELREAKK